MPKKTKNKKVQTTKAKKVLALVSENRTVVLRWTNIKALNRRRHLTEFKIILDKDAQIGTGLMFGTFIAVHVGAKIGDNVQVGSYSRIGAGSQVENDVIIEPHVKIGRGCTIGAGAHLEYGSAVQDGAHVPAGFRLKRGRLFKAIT